MKRHRSYLVAVALTVAALSTMVANVRVETRQPIDVEHSTLTVFVHKSWHVGHLRVYSKRSHTRTNSNACSPTTSGGVDNKRRVWSNL